MIINSIIQFEITNRQTSPSFSLASPGISSTALFFIFSFFLSFFPTKYYFLSFFPIKYGVSVNVMLCNLTQILTDSKNSPPHSHSQSHTHSLSPLFKTFSLSSFLQHVFCKHTTKLLSQETKPKEYREKNFIKNKNSEA